MIVPSLRRVERGHALWFEPRSVCGLEMMESQVKLPSSISGNTVAWVVYGGALNLLGRQEAEDLSRSGGRGSKSGSLRGGGAAEGVSPDLRKGQCKY
jgi:hypothetical protein